MKINIKDIPVSIWFLAAVSLALAFISKDQYLLTLFAFAGIYVIAVSGLDLLFGYSGQISMGHAAYYAIGAYTYLSGFFADLPSVLNRAGKAAESDG